MRQALQSYLEQKTARDAFAIHYRIGDEFSGETELRLRGDGAYEVWSTATQGRQLRTYSGVLGVSQIEQLVRKLLEVEIWNVRHVSDKRRTDDPRSVIAVESGGRRFEIELWVSEIRHSPAFDQAQQALLSLVRAVSSGEVLESGR